MTAIQEHICDVRSTLSQGVTLIAVSKFHPEEELMQAYEMGQRDFGENHVQELTRKAAVLPKDIRWHMLGHLQTNKVKQIIPFVHLIQSVDSIHLLEQIEKEAAKADRMIHILLELHVAHEESKSGFDSNELMEVLQHWSEYHFDHIHVDGIMGMATLTDDEEEIRRCFRALKAMHDRLGEYLGQGHYQLSMGMSHDYLLAQEEGATMVRIGTTIFGERDYSHKGENK